MRDNSSNGKIGLFGTIALVFSGMVGAGILVLPKKLAVYGSWSFIAWGIAAYMTYCIFKSFVSVRKIYTNKYNYVKNPSILDFFRMLYCENTSFLIAFGHFIALTATSAVISMTLGTYLSSFLRSDFPICSYHFSIIAVILIFVINYISIKFGNFLNQSLSFIKFVFFVSIAIAGFTYFNMEAFDFSGQTFLQVANNLSSASAIAMFAFMGIEFAVFSGDSIENPDENIPKGTLIGLILATIVFFGVYIATVFVLPDVSVCDTSVKEASGMIFGEIGGFLVGIVAILSCITSLLGTSIVQGNSFKNFVAKKWLPSFLGKESSCCFPWVGAFVSTLISICWIASSDYLHSTFGLDLSIIPIIFIALVYLAIALVDLYYNGLTVQGVLAFISSLIMLLIIKDYPIIILIMIIIYGLGFLVKHVLKESV